MKRGRQPGSSDEHYTPARYFQPWHEEFSFTLDVAATKESAKCPVYFSRKQNGLTQPWSGRVWCNPPYSDIPPWVARAHQSIGVCELIAMLLPAWTDRKWWADYVEPYRDGRGQTFHVETRFLAGRIVFGYPGDPQGYRARGGGKFGSVLVIWRNSRQASARPAGRF